MARIFRAIFTNGVRHVLVNYPACSGAALLHAAWNIIASRSGQNKLFETAMNALGGGLGAMLILPFLHFPDRAAWGLLALPAPAISPTTFAFAAAYRVADLSLGYTIMRGTAPMLTALALCLMGVPLWPCGLGRRSFALRRHFYPGS